MRAEWQVMGMSSGVLRPVLYGVVKREIRGFRFYPSMGLPTHGRYWATALGALPNWVRDHAQQHGLRVELRGKDP
jgi:hypothetical protein